MALSNLASDSSGIAARFQADVAQPIVKVRHLGRNKEGWEVAETPHFTIFHNQKKEFVEKIARAAEATRLKVNRKWFSNDGEAWPQKCELFLHATGAEYARATGMPMTTPGYAVVNSDGLYRVVSRRMDFRCDVLELLDAILPHETTHVVLAGRLGNYRVPHWADEAIAVLSEPKDRIDAHRHNLKKCAKDQGGLFDLKELMEMKGYPPPKRIATFYAQSICLTDFLVKEKSPVTFTKFIREGLSKGYETSLKTHYDCSFDDFEQRWRKFLVQEKLVDPPTK